MLMRWLSLACPHCGGSLYYGTSKKAGYKGNKWLAKCINCSRMVKVTMVDRAKVMVEVAR